MLTFIRYFEVNFTFALVDCVGYNEDFAKSRFVKWRFCSIHLYMLLFWPAKENRLLYRGLRYIEVR